MHAEYVRHAARMLTDVREREAAVTVVLGVSRTSVRRWRLAQPAHAGKPSDDVVFMSSKYLNMSFTEWNRDLGRTQRSAQWRALLVGQLLDGSSTS